MRIVADTDLMIPRSDLRRVPQEGAMVRFKRILAGKRQAAMEARVATCVMETDHPGLISDFTAAKGKR